MRQVIRTSPRAQRLLVDRHVERQLETSDPRLVVCVVSDLNAQQVERLRRLTPRATWVFWYPDALINLGDHRVLQAPYERLFFKDPFLVDVLASRTDLPVHMLAQACNPDHHRPERPRDDTERRRYECDVAVAGNLYPYRILLLEGLPQEVSIRIYGNPARPLTAGPERLLRAQAGEFVAGRTKAVAFGCARVVLNTMHFAEVRGVNSRLFEATACGGFVLTHRSPEIGEYFVPGEEIAVFDSPAEMRDAIQHYLRHQDERERLAAAGQARAHSHHTYRHRVLELLAVAGLRELLPASSP